LQTLRQLELPLQHRDLVLQVGAVTLGPGRVQPALAERAGRLCCQDALEFLQVRVQTGWLDVRRPEWVDSESRLRTAYPSHQASLALPCRRRDAWHDPACDPRLPRSGHELIAISVEALEIEMTVAIEQHDRTPSAKAMCAPVQTSGLGSISPPSPIWAAKSTHPRSPPALSASARWPADADRKHRRHRPRLSAKCG